MKKWIKKRKVEIWYEHFFLLLFFIPDISMRQLLAGSTIGKYNNVKNHSLTRGNNWDYKNNTYFTNRFISNLLICNRNLPLKMVDFNKISSPWNVPSIINNFRIAFDWNVQHCIADGRSEVRKVPAASKKVVVSFDIHANKVKVFVSSPEQNGINGCFAVRLNDAGNQIIFGETKAYNSQRILQFFDDLFFNVDGFDLLQSFSFKNQNHPLRRNASFRRMVAVWADHDDVLIVIGDAQAVNVGHVEPDVCRRHCWFEFPPLILNFEIPNFGNTWGRRAVVVVDDSFPVPVDLSACQQGSK